MVKSMQARMRIKMGEKTGEILLQMFSKTCSLFVTRKLTIGSLQLLS